MPREGLDDLLNPSMHSTQRPATITVVVETTFEHEVFERLLAGVGT